MRGQPASASTVGLARTLGIFKYTPWPSEYRRTQPVELLPKIALFYALVWALLWYLRRSPQSWLGQLAFSWNGPFPTVGERWSEFRRRQSLYALSWLLQIALVAAAIILVTSVYEPLRASQAFQVVAAFALFIGAGMAVLGASYCALASVKARVFGPDPIFESVAPSQVEAQSEDA